VLAPGFKHRDFWTRESSTAVVIILLLMADLEEAGNDVARITDDEAQAVLDRYDE
jgi:hypothetical protein